MVHLNMAPWRAVDGRTSLRSYKIIKKGRLPRRIRVIGWSTWTKPNLICGLSKLTALPLVISNVIPVTNVVNCWELRQLPALQFRWTTEVHCRFENK